MAVDIGTGMTFSGFSAEITNISWDGISRESIDTTHLGTTTARTFMPTDLYDAGEITIEGHMDSTLGCPIDGAAATLTITFPGSDTWSASAFCTSFSFNSPLEDKMTFTATFKCSGAITD